MAATSKHQFNFMASIASGTLKKKGLSKKKAAEYIKGQNPKGLPARSNKSKKKRKTKR